MIKLIELKTKKPIAPDKAMFMAAMNQAVRDTITKGQRTIQEYPPQVLTKTGYVRTGTLKRSWSSELHSGGNRIEGIVGSNANIAPYNRRVQGTQAQQDELFVDAGWMNIDELAEMMEGDLNKRARDAIRRTF